MKLIFFFFCILTKIFGSSCPNGSVEFRGICYLFQTNSTSFFNAELACNGLNGHLASVHDGFANGYITGQALNIFHESTDFWIGLNTLMIPGNWSWTDKSTYDFKEWAPGQPHNISMSCAALKIQTRLWSSDECLKFKPFVCAISTTVVPTTTAVPAYLNCPERWVSFEPTFSCYREYGSFFNQSNWTNAENYCKSVGAHLVSIHSYEEAKFVSTIIDGEAWTGLYSNDNQKTWKWSDESPVDYLPWHSRYPMNFTTEANCVWIWAGTIYNSDCAGNWYTLCKKPASLFV